MKKIIIWLLAIILMNNLLFSQDRMIKLSSSDETLIKLTSKSVSEFSGISSVSEIAYFPVKTTEGNFIELKIPGYNHCMIEGSPKLPVLKRLIEIPVDAQISVSIISYTEEELNLNTLDMPFRIIPAQPPLSKSEDPSLKSFIYDKEVYQTNDFVQYPVVDVKMLGMMRGVQLGRIEICPFQYNPVTNRLKIFNDIQFKIEFLNADMEMTLKLRETYFSPSFEKNFSKILNYHPVAEKDVITTYPQKFVIVSDPMFQTQLQPFVQWKTKKGFMVVEAYTNNPLVGTTTSSIKSYLTELYVNATPSEPAPTYVLFVGDVAQIPVFTGTTSTHVTDLYYCTYDGSADFYPDVYYGRFSATNAAQLQPQLDKTLEYEQYLFTDELFLNDVVLVSGVDASMAPTYGNGQINYGTSNYFNLAHGITDYTWLYPASETPGVSGLIKNRVSQGCSFLNYTAHCWSGGWGDPSFSVSDVANLENAHKYPLSVGNCCSSNEYQVAECFGEALMRAENKGAIGHIGGSNSTYWSEDYWWGVGNAPVSANPTYMGSGLGAYDCLFHDHGEMFADWFVASDQILHAGNLAITEAGSSMENYYWEIYHLMGDPSLMPYISVPSALNVSYLDPVPVGTISLQVNVEPHSYAAISDNGILLDAKYSGNGNSVTLSFNPLLNPGDIDLVVTKQFRKPYIGILSVVPGNTVNDAQVTTISTPETFTNILSADAYPSFTIRNLGSAMLTNVQTGYKIDNGVIVSQLWTGTLSQYQTQIVTFPMISLPPGMHTFTAFVSYPNGVVDEYHPGDTISKIFYVTAGDAAVISHNSFQSVYCAPDTVTPKIAFANKGTVQLLSADINYQIDNQPAVTIPWTGNLNTNEHSMVVFPTITLTPGNHSFKAFTSLPNGGSDENPVNDMKQISYEVLSNAQIVEISILTDDYGSETTWNIVNDATSQVIYSGGPFDDWSPQLFVEELCFGDGCYTFNLLDSYGDGQQGAPNNGTYSVSNSTTSQVYGSGGGNWGSIVSVNFCISTVSTEEFDRTELNIYPNPAQNFLNVSGLTNVSVLSLYDIKGKLLYHIMNDGTDIKMDVSMLPSGIYSIKVVSYQTVITEKILILGK